MCLIRIATYLLLISGAAPLLANRHAVEPRPANPPQPIVEDAVTDRYRPLVFDQEKLAGLLARRLGANSEGFLEHTDEALFLRNVTTSGRNEVPEASESGGKLLEAFANAYEYRRDEHLRAALNRVAKQVSAEQSDERYWTEASGDERAWRQELLLHKCDLLGLLADYRVTGDEDAMTAARKIGNRLVKMFPKSSADQAQYLRATVLIEPFVALYRYTEATAYLDLCKSAADAWIQSKGERNNETADGLSVLDGLIDLYRVTGDETYFRPVLAGWAEVKGRALSITGVPMPTGDSGDGCSTLSWLQLTLNLLQITGESAYADQLERTIYNQLFAGQDANTGSLMETTPLNGTKQPAALSDACVAAESQALTLVPAAVWGRYGNGIAVLLYNAGRATFQLSHRRGTVQLYSETAFPENGEFLLHVEPAHSIRFPLRLRVPEWTSTFAVDFAGNHLLGKPGEYLTINREWKAGDTVKISIDMTARILSRPSSDPGEVAVQRGPQVLALAKNLNPGLKDLAGATLLSSDLSQPRLAPLANGPTASWVGEQAYSIKGEYQGQPQQLVLAPFADATHCRVWLKKPRLSTASAH